MSDTRILDEIFAVIDDRFRNPKSGSYVSGLAADEKGIDRILEKIGEESTEFIIAVKNGDSGRTTEEAADLLFHLLVAIRAAGISLDDLVNELRKRKK
ncbi:MAG TPA: phosphoribosyl-ATP diphosphatase [Methanoregulaceae archaeon]|nr:phosphoribosyl-ATP diphosphatase [Methanoregulaceae archaeon]